jgi:hypothetical protein
MADTFGTIGFTILAAGMARGQGAAITVTHIPGGSISYVDYGGQTPRTQSYNLLLSEANYYLLEGAVGGTAALVTAVDGTITSALLLDVQRAQRIPVSGTTFVQANFLVVTP